MSQINRRALLGAVPAVALAPAAAFAMPSAEITSIEHLVREWKVSRDAYDNHQGSEAEGDRIFEHHNAIEDEIARLPAETLRDVYLKIIVADDDPGGAGRSRQQQALFEEACAATGWSWDAADGLEAAPLGSASDKPECVARALDNAEGATLASLPFVRDTTKAERRAGMLPRIFWEVTPSGNYTEDCSTGERYAVLALQYMAANDVPPLLGLVVRDMIRRGPDHSGIEIGFLSVFGRAGTVLEKLRGMVRKDGETS